MALRVRWTGRRGGGFEGMGVAMKGRGRYWLGFAGCYDAWHWQGMLVGKVHLKSCIIWYMVVMFISWNYDYLQLPRVVLFRLLSDTVAGV